MSIGKTLVSGTFEIAVENTAEKITASSTLLSAAVIRAAEGNGAVVHVGPPATVGATSFALKAGESVNLDIIDIARFGVYGKAKDKIEFLGLAAV